MKTVGEIRLDNLELLVQEFETLEAVAERGGTSSVYLSQVRNQAADQATGRRRQMGEKMARRLEEGCKKPSGWMDAPHEPVADDDDILTSTTVSVPTIGQAIRHLAALLQPMSEMQRVMIGGAVSKVVLDPNLADEAAAMAEKIAGGEIPPRKSTMEALKAIKKTPIGGTERAHQTKHKD